MVPIGRMSKVSWIVLFALAFTACKKKAEVSTGSGSGSDSAAAGSGALGGSGSASSGSGSASGSGSGSGSAAAGSGSAGSAAAGSGSDDDNADLEFRKGKKTGLGGPDEKPEVITEDLIRKLGTGGMPVARFIDPKLGVHQRIVMPGGAEKPVPSVIKDHCGDAEKVVAAYLKAMVDRETRGKADDDGQISCSNEFATKPDPDFGKDDGAEPEIPGVPLQNVTCGSSGAGEYDELRNVIWVPDATRGFRIAAIVSTEQGARFGKVFVDAAKSIAAAKCK